MTRFPLLLAVLLAANAAAVPAAAADVAPVVHAERAFAGFADAEGIGPAFRRFVAPDGILFAPHPVAAGPQLRGNPPGKLRWWPIYAGIALSGDLGFSTGPYISGSAPAHHGHFFTIWKKQPDGSWRWLLDHGIRTAEAAPEGPDAPVGHCPDGRRSPAAGQAVAAAEAAFARRLAADARAAYAEALARDGRLLREGHQPAVGRAAFAATLADGPDSLASSPLGRGVSKAGDLAYTYGSASWQQEGKPVDGHYIRIWQRRAQGWVLLVDETVPVPRPQHD